MAINFPNPATLNQTHTVGSKTWVYNGYAWDLVTANTSPILNTAISAFTQANAAYVAANSGITIGQSAFTQANAAYSQANSGVAIGQSAFTQANAAYTAANSGITIGQSAFTQANVAYNTANTKFSSSGGTISGSVTITTDLSVTGNVYLGGNVTTLSSNNLSINDPLIYLAQDNPANIQDIGLVGHFTSDHYQHTGFVRDATDGVWKLFSNVAAEPTSTVDFTGAIYDTLQIGSILAANAIFSIGNGFAPFVVASNTLVANLNSDLLDGQHGAYYSGLSNTAYVQANAAYAQANTGVTIGQAAFSQANSAFSQANSAFSQANSAFSQANSGFSQANSAFTQANTGITIGQAAFSQANSAFSQANSAFTQANTAYGQANTGVTIAQNAFNQANTALGLANSAYNKANTGGGGLLPTSIQTANYTAVVNDLVRCNTAAGAFSVTFPTSPPDGSTIAIVDVFGTFYTNNLTINRGGTNTIEGDTAVILDINNAYTTFMYNYGTANWRLLETPIGSLGNVTANTSLGGMVKISGTVLANAVAGVDYLAPPSGTSILKANSSGALVNAVANVDYLTPPSGTSILKANSSGALVNAVAGVDYVFANTATTFTKPQTPSTSAETAPSTNAITWDLTTNQIFRINLNANITTFNLTGTLSSLIGNQYEVIIRYNGGSTVTWNSNMKWTAATAPTLTGTSGKIDVLTFVVASTDGTNYYLVNTGIKLNVG
jgi:acetyltransferase-like isoleucine patch superfamily enzyme